MNRALAVYPKNVKLNVPTMVGAWLPPRRITKAQLEKLRELQRRVQWGQFGFSKGTRGFALKCLARFTDREMAHKQAVALCKIVREIFRVRCIVLQLPTYRHVSRALAV